MTVKRLGLIMNGVTGRMGLNQHLIRSIVAIRDQGGVMLSNGDRVMPDPILVGRDAEKVAALAKRFDIIRHTTDLDKALADKNDEIFFDAATTQARPGLLTKAIEAGLPKRTFDRRFRAATGYSPLAYVQALRVEEAKQLLETGTAPVEAIGREVGYADAASFRRLFRRLAGMTPGDYRRKFHVPRFVGRAATARKPKMKTDARPRPGCALAADRCER